MLSKLSVFYQGNRTKINNSQLSALHYPGHSKATLRVFHYKFWCGCPGFLFTIASYF